VEERAACRWWGMPLTQGCAVSEQHTALMMVVAELNSAPLVQTVGAKN
jgi:hypothetical protein